MCDLESGCSAGAADRWRWAAWWVIYGENRGILPPSVAVTHAPPCSRFSRITYTVIRPRAHATRPAGGRAGLAVSSEVAGGWWMERRSQPASAQSQEHARWLDRLDTPVCTLHGVQTRSTSRCCRPSPAIVFVRSPISESKARELGRRTLGTPNLWPAGGGPARLPWFPYRGHNNALRHWPRFPHPGDGES